MLSAAEAGSGKDADLAASSMALAKKLAESNKSAAAKWKRKSLVVVRTSGNNKKGGPRNNRSRSGSRKSRSRSRSRDEGGGAGVGVGTDVGVGVGVGEGEDERPEWNNDPVVAHAVRPAALDNNLELLDDTEKAVSWGEVLAACV